MISKLEDSNCLKKSVPKNPGRIFWCHAMLRLFLSATLLNYLGARAPEAAAKHHNSETEVIVLLLGKVNQE